MKRLNGAGTRALDMAKQFTVAQRTIAIIGVAVLVLGAIALANYLGAPSYSVLYSNISQANASSVVAQLEKDKVDYQLQDGGQTILVPADSVDAERLASANLLSSGAGGYSLLDNLGVTASEFQQNVTYKRAIEGELAKTIGSIDGVASASVQLAVPQQSVFSDQKEDPTASVFVNATTPLSSDQVGAIVHLVAAAYPGLTTDNVSVVDSKGDTLSAVGGGSTSGSDAAADYESATKASVQAMLDKVVGPGNAVVTVAADVSSSSGTKRSTSYTQGANTPLAESSNSTSYANGGGAAASGGASGVLGDDTTDTSTGGNSATASGASGSSSPSYTQSQSTKNNAVDKTETNETIVPGTLNRQSIAVAIDSKVTGVSLGSLQTMVSNAAGVNATRGDTVSVTSVPFSTAAAKTAAAALAESTKAQSAEAMTGIITTAIKVVGGLVLFVLVVGLLRKLFKRPEPTAVDAGAMNVVPVVPGDPGYGGYAPTQQLGGFAAPGALRGGPGTAPTVALRAPLDPAMGQLQADVDALAGADPNQTADLLRALMSDRAGV
ncbi:flagellar basal-body MS-ring/collar protein FliF [uncultured Amnibacterium sp.]|uniref:flagellar basal-body MS-ring/collar protein FliF n=1 Tax=uncultured Amnibacterium sp. TaxID=1631851 RepID=UPI0035CC1935